MIKSNSSSVSAGVTKVNFSLGLGVNRRTQYKPQYNYEPEAFQQDIHKSDARYNALLGSPGLGKTILGAFEVLRFMRHGVGNGIILLPTYGMLFDTALRELRKWAPPGLKIPRSHQNTTIELPGNRYLFLRSAEYPKTIDGLDSIHFVWVDEGDLIAKDVWYRIKERLNRESPFGQWRRVIITATPQLVNGQSWIRDEVHDKFLNGETTNYFVRKATVWESTRVSDEMKRRIEEDNPPGSWGRARYDAEYVVATEGLIYPELPAIGMPFEKVVAKEADEIILGIDCGYSPDPFVCLLLCRHGSIWTAYDEVRFTKENEKRISVGIYKMLESHGLVQPFMLSSRFSRLAVYHDHDSNQMANIKGELETLGIFGRYVPAKKQRKQTSIAFVRDMMISQKIQINTRATYYELCAYARKERTTDTQKDLTIHKHSHGPDALRYGLFSHLSGPQNRAIY